MIEPEIELSWLELLWKYGPITVFVLATVLTSLLALAYVGRRVSRRAPRPAADVIDVAQLGAQGPRSAGAVLALYYLPARVALAVIAPVGLGKSTLTMVEAKDALGKLLPGMVEVLDQDLTVLQTWPAQRSSQGFSGAFFQRTRLPGEHGKGTPWCTVAGKVEIDAAVYLVGLVLCAAEKNNFSRIAVEQHTQWYDILRVQRI